MPSFALLVRAGAHGDTGPGIALGSSVGLPRLAAAWDHRWRSKGAAPPDPEWGALAFEYLPGLLESGCDAAPFSEASRGKIGGPSAWRER